MKGSYSREEKKESKSERYINLLHLLAVVSSLLAQPSPWHVRQAASLGQQRMWPRTVSLPGCQMAIARFLDRMSLALRGLKDWLRCATPHTLHPGTIQGKEGIKFCHLATLRSVPLSLSSSPLGPLKNGRFVEYRGLCATNGGGTDPEEKKERER